VASLKIARLQYRLFQEFHAMSHTVGCRSRQTRKKIQIKGYGQNKYKNKQTNKQTSVPSTPEQPSGQNSHWAPLQMTPGRLDPANFSPFRTTRSTRHNSYASKAALLDQDSRGPESGLRLGWDDRIDRYIPFVWAPPRV